MFFKNMRVYKLSKDFEISVDDIHDQLSLLVFKPCDSYSARSIGWVSPREMGAGIHPEVLAYIANKHILLTACVEEKILPASVVKKALEERVSKLEAKKLRRLKRSEKYALKDEVLHTLLSRAFSRFTSLIFGSIYITTKLLSIRPVLKKLRIS